MIKTTLPVVEKSINDKNELVTVEKQIDVVIDTSLFAEERWENTSRLTPETKLYLLTSSV